MLPTQITSDGPGLASEPAVRNEAEQRDTKAGLPQPPLPADGGVDLQPPDEAFPPFLWSNIMQSFIMREAPREAI